MGEHDRHGAGPARVDAHGDVGRLLWGSGAPLGGLDDARYDELATEFRSGDTLLLLSDGLPELAGPSGQPFGYLRLRAGFLGVASESPERIVAALAAAGRSWLDGGELADDMTFVVVRRC